MCWFCSIRLQFYLKIIVVDSRTGNGIAHLISISIFWLFWFSYGVKNDRNFIGMILVL